MPFNGIISSRWGPGPEIAGATGDAGQAQGDQKISRAAGRIKRGVPGRRPSGHSADPAGALPYWLLLVTFIFSLI